MPSLSRFDQDAKFQPEGPLLDRLVAEAALGTELRARISASGSDLVRRIRREAAPTMMEHFLSEYGLSTREGLALMSLAEALLRVPDAATIDALIEDKIAGAAWHKHFGAASSHLVNSATLALALTGKILDPAQTGVLRGLVKRLGQPVVRAATGRAMKEMGRQFVLGQDIEAALKNARKLEARGYGYSYDMLGEAAMTAADAAGYARSYAQAIRAIAAACTKGSVKDNPGISIKLSALHPRYEVAQEARVMAELVPVVLDLARAAKAAGMGMNIDAEEQDRLVLSLQVIEAVLSDPSLAGWDGFGVVVQAYGKRAGLAIDWLYELATRLDRRIMVRLVKGAYWDSEIKHAQVEALPDFPLFTTKTATDVSYIANARKLIGYADRIYPQFATHNAHTVAAILTLAGDISYEFQRLHGMGERLHDIVLAQYKTRCRIYAPVGAHRDLLAYLVRRLLENGANSSFVNQIVSEDIPAETVARDPFAALGTAGPVVAAPADIFGAARENSTGFDLSDAGVIARIQAAQDLPLPLPLPAPATCRPATGEMVAVGNPATNAPLAEVMHVDADTTRRAIADAQPWDAPAAERARVLRAAADLYEAQHPLIFATLAREAGKTLPDAVGELREAVDFLRYYAEQGEARPESPRGTIAAISPWNFPLAIFTGQIAAALMAGNAVLAKPAEATPIIASLAIRLLHDAGVPLAALQLLTGAGNVVGTALTRDPKVAGMVFTGSTATARQIARNMAQGLRPGTPLIAETGGLNAMIVDSTALPEQAVRDIVNAAFRSAGQRCSALRCLYVQEDIAPQVIKMIKGAMDQLRIGDPSLLTTDIGPVIDRTAQAAIQSYIDSRESAVLHRLPCPQGGSFVAPTMLRVKGIEDLDHEVFGPVLHVATFAANELDAVVEAINAKGYGLTFGLHSRITSRVEDLCARIKVGNIYVNRNQIGAVVGSQPFGGEGLSGTGPKAGGPNYLTRFYAGTDAPMVGTPWATAADPAVIAQGLTARDTPILAEHQLAGPTGESNRLRFHARAPLLCLGPGAAAMAAQRAAVEAMGGTAVCVEGQLDPAALPQIEGISAVLYWGEDALAAAYAAALAASDGPIRQLVTGLPDPSHVTLERHICIDTTAAGGNAALLAG